MISCAQSWKKQYQQHSYHQLVVANLAAACSLTIAFSASEGALGVFSIARALASSFSFAWAILRSLRVALSFLVSSFSCAYMLTPAFLSYC